TVQFSGGGAGASLPADYPFTTGAGNDNGVHTFSATLVTVGSQTITATDSVTGTITGNAVVSVGKASTTTAVTSSLNPAINGQSVTLTATISVTSPGSGTPTGTVDFLDGGVTIAAGRPVSGGTASYTTSSLSIGGHTITAVYSGDTKFLTSTSS